MRRFNIILLLWVGLLGPAALATADETVSVTPATEGAALSVRLPVASGVSVTGATWLNNDATSPFHRLLLVEAVPGQPPDLTGGASVLTTVSGPTLATGSATFVPPVTSSTGAVFIVFEVAEGAERRGDGLNGGPGIGYSVEAGAPDAFITADGYEWTQLAPNLELEISLVTGAAKSGATSLASLPPGKRPRPRTEDAVANPVTEFRVTAAPNPFNPTVALEFSLSASSKVQVRVHDVRGRLVRTIEQWAPAGPVRFEWNGRDSAGAPVASGTYFLTTRASTHSAVNRVVLVK